MQQEYYTKKKVPYITKMFWLPPNIFKPDKTNRKTGQKLPRRRNNDKKKKGQKDKQ
jgi:prophage tail gpP-like protein